MAYLTKAENTLFLSTYLIVLCFGVYQIYLVGDEISTNGVYSGFTTGWKILDVKRDDLDYEWETWKAFSMRNIIWFVSHLTLSECTRSLAPEFVPLAHAFIGLAFIYQNFHHLVLFLIATKIATFYAASRSRSKWAVWLVATIWVLLLNIIKTEQIQEPITEYLQIGETNSYETIIILSWMFLKLISFTLDCVQQQSVIDFDGGNQFNVINLLGYVFYFPNMMVGPIVIYKRYAGMLKKNVDPLMIYQSGEVLGRIKALVLNLMRFGFWMMLTDFALHYIYVNNLMYNPQILQNVNPWALYSFGYVMGQFFYNKYLVAYGFGLSFVAFDRITTPGMPKCIGRIHLYSDMWKYFDQGLYEFLFTYIYKNFYTKSSSVWYKAIGSFVTFTFIYLWHGFYKFVLIWAIMNFVCVQAEKCGKKIAKSRAYQARVGDWSETNRDRLTAFFGSQLYIPAAMSNFFFIGGFDVGMIYMKRTYYGEGVIGYIVLSFCSLCIYNTCELISRNERTDQIRNTKKT